MENKFTKLDQYSTKDAYQTYFNMFIFMLLFSFVFFCISPLFDTKSPNFVYIQGLVSPIMFCALFFWQNKGKRYNTIQIIGLNKKVEVKHIGVSIVSSVLSIILFASFSTLFLAVAEATGFQASERAIFRKDHIGFLFLSIFEFALLPAIFEELIFRGIVFKGLSTEHNKVTAILLSAIMFSFMHGSLQQTVYQFILGVIFALIMLATDNIIYPMIAHFVNNTIVVIMDFFTPEAASEVPYVFNFINIFMPILLACIGVILLIYCFRKIDKNQEVKEGVKIYKSYSFDEKKFFIASFVIAGLTWLINTIGMYIGVV